MRRVTRSRGCPNETDAAALRVGLCLLDHVADRQIAMVDGCVRHGRSEMLGSAVLVGSHHCPLLSLVTAATPWIERVGSRAPASFSPAHDDDHAAARIAALFPREHRRCTLPSSGLSLTRSAL